VPRVDLFRSSGRHHRQEGRHIEKLRGQLSKMTASEVKLNCE
jgi:hypothetical protein